MLRRTYAKLIQPFFTRRFLKFALVGASGVVVNLGVLALLLALDLHDNLASALAIEVSLLSNFLVNYLWTFGDRRGHGSVLTQALRFHTVCLIGACIQFVTFVSMNVAWFLLLAPPEAHAAYLSGADTWAVRWLWHPFVAPPDVGSLAYASQLFGIGLGMVWNYLLNFYWTWSMHRRSGARVLDRPRVARASMEGGLNGS
ncbi:GtrA family protein [Haliangium sp.]|uniref:GtrA family protein n=1 Tax=Haliangium sp. TaxID=2663208 RepID=UPI003D0E0EBC